MDFGDELKRIRESRGMTVNQLAMYSEVSSATISRVENKKRGIPRPKYIRKLADALKYPYADLMKLAGHLDKTEDENEEKNVDKRDSIDKLIDYLDMALSNDEIKERMVFQVGDIVLNDEEADEYLTFIKLKRAMKKQQLAGLSNSKDI